MELVGRQWRAVWVELHRGESRGVAEKRRGRQVGGEVGLAVQAVREETVESMQMQLCGSVLPGLWTMTVECRLEVGWAALT